MSWSSRRQSITPHWSSMQHCMRHRRERWRSAVSYNVAPRPSPCESPSPSPSHSPTLFLTLTLTGKARDERRGICHCLHSILLGFLLFLQMVETGQTGFLNELRAEEQALQEHISRLLNCLNKLTSHSQP